jgi:hypothetical protein
MTKTISLVLIGILSLTLILSSTTMVLASPSDVDGCYDSHQRCFERALMGNYGVIKTTLMLTACDVGLFRCVVAFAI